MWEDETNVNGGKWIVRLKKGVAARYWEDLVRSHPPLLRRPSPHAREIWQLTQRLLGRSSSRCWGGSSRWETRSAGPCSPCATRRTSFPSGSLQPRPSPQPEHTPSFRPSAPRALCAPSTGPQAPRSSSGLCTPSTGPLHEAPLRCLRPTCAHARTAHRQEQICRQPASVHADQDDAVQRAAAADGRLARVQEAHRLDARQLFLPQCKLQLRLRAAHPCTRIQAVSRSALCGSRASTTWCMRSPESGRVMKQTSVWCVVCGDMIRLQTGSETSLTELRANTRETRDPQPHPVPRLGVSLFQTRHSIQGVPMSSLERSQIKTALFKS